MQTGPTLITGFEGYGGRADNPSARIARALDRHSVGGRPVVGRVLPVTCNGLRERLRVWLEEIDPALVISLGLAPGEPVIRLERIAANHADFEMPDNTGQVLQGRLVETGVTALEATLPLPEIRAALLAAGIPARISQTAGTFVCNATMYQLLDLCAARTPAPAAGFIHLPMLPAQICEQLDPACPRESEALCDLASMALSTQIDAVECAIGACYR